MAWKITHDHMSCAEVAFASRRLLTHLPLHGVVTVAPGARFERKYVHLNQCNLSPIFKTKPRVDVHSAGGTVRPDLFLTITDILMYKDGMAYPWPSGVSNLILYPESANQTVYARTVSTVDSGNYTCTVRNDSHVISHTVILSVIESEVEKLGYTGVPLPTYKPRDQYASRGESIRFFCEAFVGHIDLPDAKSEVRWWRGIPSGAEEGADSDLKMEHVQEFPNLPYAVNPSKYHHLHKKSHTKLRQRLHQETVPREESQILGAYLLIHDIQTDDFGEYRCAVKNAAGEHTLQMSSWLREEDDRIRNDEVEEVTFLAPDNSMVTYLIYFILFGIVVCFLLLVLNLKNRCRRKTDGDRKEYDVCIFYESKKNTATHSITAKDMALSHILPASH
ncbi:hypothetical protein J437_LFUL004440 [Ladona fulva]|uniref:Soluble interferon alpha/beta receptor OPG204 n=1 Tax=Ladona fulva TaxID=123851 RepID=A0A8K0NUU5_LADFU|nr:hypothetical protein J437_LFUL004440 [Ladona fulva]